MVAASVHAHARQLLDLQPTDKGGFFSPDFKFIYEHFNDKHAIILIPVLDGPGSSAKSRSSGKKPGETENEIVSLLQSAKIAFIELKHNEADFGMVAESVHAHVRQLLDLQPTGKGGFFSPDSDIITIGDEDADRLNVVSYDGENFSGYTQGELVAEFVKQHDIATEFSDHAFEMLQNLLAATSTEYLGHVRVNGLSKKDTVGVMVKCLKQNPRASTEDLIQVVENFLAVCYEKLEVKQLSLEPLQRQDHKLIKGGELAVPNIRMLMLAMASLQVQ